MLSVVERIVVVYLACVFGFTAFTFAVAFVRAPRPPRVWTAFFKEMVATLVLIPAWPLFALVGARYAARPLKLSANPAGSGADSDGKGARRGVPVMLLHGYLMNRTNWLWLGRELASRGIGPLYGYTYLTLGSIERSAQRLARQVEIVCAREGARQVDLVCHSLGGLVARHYAENLGGAPRVRRLITIATPHRGTRWARVAAGSARAHMVRGWPLPRRTEAGGPRYTAIWSRCDNLVIPPESAAFPSLAAALAPDGSDADMPVSAAELEAELESTAATIDDVVFDDLGHLSLLVSPRVADAVAERLSE